MKWQNPEQFYEQTIGKSIDVDGYYSAQCWDYFAFYNIQNGYNVNTYCSITGYAGDLYKLRYEKGYDKYYEFFYPRNAKRGDWIFWDQHVAMVWTVYSDGRVQCLGQNQGGVKKVTLKTYSLNSALGCMRDKGWIKPMEGWIKSNGKWYFFVDGEKVTGWKKISWSKGTDWFYFDSEGVMVTGWRNLTYKGNHCWFWFDENGAMATGFRKITWKGKECFFLFDKDGVMQTGTKKMELTFDASGALTGGKAV